MKTADEVMRELAKRGSDSYKKTFLRHGAREPFFGVKIEDLKKIQKVIKKDYQLAKDLFDTGNSDAMYLAGLIADETKMTKKDLRSWAQKASWHMLSESTVAWVAAESPHGWELGLRWIDDPSPQVASSGWSALASVVALRADEELDLDALRALLERVAREIHGAPNRVRYTMNGFVISVGSHEDESPFTFFYNPNPPVEFFGRGVNVDVAWLEGRTIRVSGNSFATPHLSGICALILAKHPELTPFQVKSVLYLTSSNVGGAR